MVPSFRFDVQANRANYVSPAGPPRTGNETPRVSTRVFCVRTYVCIYVYIYTCTLTAPGYTYTRATTSSRSEWKRSWIKPGRGGIRYDGGGGGGDNLRLYPRAGQRFN